jgi:hypothetical protein
MVYFQLRGRMRSTLGEGRAAMRGARKNADTRTDFIVCASFLI